MAVVVDEEAVMRRSSCLPQCAAIPPLHHKRSVDQVERRRLRLCLLKGRKEGAAAAAAAAVLKVPSFLFIFLSPSTYYLL